MARFGSLGTQYFDNAGDPLIEGKIYFKESGTDTDKDTFADVNLTIANTNPVILSGEGRQPNVFFNGSAKAILTDSNDVQIEVRDPVGGDAEEGVFSSWDSLTIYNQSDIVIGSDGLFYLSITSGNQDNDPTADLVNWSEIRFIRIWNANETYTINRIVEGSDGALYTSLINSNLNNDPTTDSVNWKSSATSLVDEVVVSGSSVTEIDFTGLDINLHKGYLIEFELITSTGPVISMYVNNDTTTTNYDNQALFASGASVTSARANSAEIFSPGPIVPTYVYQTTRLSSPALSRPIAFSAGNISNDGGIVLGESVWSKRASVANITQLTFVATGLGATIDAGSKISIYSRGE